VVKPKSLTKPAPWHLGATQRDLAFAEFQHALICLSEAFYRYVGKSLSIIAADPYLTGQDSVILHTIYLGERPKSITDLQHFTNRSDVANIQYSVRKLKAAKLIERAASGEGRSATYRLTAKGKQIAHAYAKARHVLLARFPEHEQRLVERLADAKDLMVILTGLYDQGSRVLMTGSETAPLK